MRFYFTWWQVNERKKKKLVNKCIQKQKRLCDDCPTPRSGNVDFFSVLLLQFCSAQFSWGFKKISSGQLRTSFLMEASGKINYCLCSCCPGMKRGKKCLATCGVLYVQPKSQSPFEFWSKNNCLMLRTYNKVTGSVYITFGQLGGCNSKSKYCTLCEVQWSKMWSVIRLAF